MFPNNRQGLCRRAFLIGLLLAAGAPAQSPGKLAAEAGASREAGRIDEAIALYRKALEVQPSWAEGWWYLGTLLYDRDDYAGAAAALDRVAALSPKDPAPPLMLALCEARLNRRAEALAHIGQGRRLGFTSDARLRRVILFTEGTLRLEAGEFARAQDALDAVAREGSTEEELLLALGQAVLGIRTPDDASREIVRRAGWAEHYAALGNFSAAASEYARLAADAPRFHDLQFARGRFLLANHQDDQAVEAFRREIANTPNHLLARLGIAGIRLNGDPDAGLSYAEQAVKLAPRLAEAHYLLGAILFELGTNARAIEELETARRLDSGDARIYFKLSRAYARANRREDAARANAAFLRLSDPPGPAARE